MGSLVQDNQAIDSRFGEAVWITDFITPNNPDVRLLHQRLTYGLDTVEARVAALWRYTANIPYRHSVSSKLIIGGKSFSQKDTWLFPAETIISPVANCANKSFLLTSLVRNELGPEDVRCALGHVRIDGIGAHAWVEADMGQKYILETTQPDIREALIPAGRAEAYEKELEFSDRGVYAVSERPAAKILNEQFGFCAIPFLRDYICVHCQGLEG